MLGKGDPMQEKRYKLHENGTRQHQRYERRSVMHRCMEVMVDTFPVVNLYRFNRTHVASQSNNQVLRRTTDLINSINIVILVMDLMHLVQRHYGNRLAVDQFDVINTIQSRINVFLTHLGANVFTVDRYGFIRIRIP